MSEQEHDGDPWAEAHMDPSPWCETCEGNHDDHAKWLAERAKAVAGWSESAESLEEALGKSRWLYRAGTHYPEGSQDAASLYEEIGRLVADLRRITDAAAWRAHQEAERAEAEAGTPGTVAECGYCTTRITLLGDAWTADDGTTSCTDTSAPYVPHKPKEASDGE